MTSCLALHLALAVLAAEPWTEGEHFTGEWNGDRQTLAAHGLTFDLAYAAETFVTSAGAISLMGHLDAAITLETQKMGLWKGGRFYLLGQNNHGTGINELVGSATAISNLEAPPYTQVTELFYEQALFDGVLRIRVGKQDANREFGTPRYGGNFLNNNFGMFPASALPSYPTTGLGAVVVFEPTDWIVGKLCLFEGNPMVERLGFDTAFAPDATVTTALAAAVTHRFGADHRHGGTSSLGAWLQVGELPQRFHSNFGLMVQNDERIYSDPSNAENNGGLNLITRIAWSQPDRNEIPLYFGASIAWHGITEKRNNDTVGIGFGYFTVNTQANGTPGRGSEVFIEAFYKLRVTRFFSIQPDVQLYNHPGGDGPTTLLAGVRLKLKL